MKAGELLSDFRDTYPKQHKQSGMLYAERYAAAPVAAVTVHQILVSDEGLFELKGVTIEHPNKKKTPMEWRRWMDRYYTRILGAVVQSMERERGGLWKVRAILGWSSHASGRKHSKVAPRKRHKTKAKRR